MLIRREYECVLFDLAIAGNRCRFPLRQPGLGACRAVTVTASGDSAWATAGATLTLQYWSGPNGPYPLGASIAVGGGEAHIGPETMPPGATEIEVESGTADADALVNVAVVMEFEAERRDAAPSADQAGCGCSHG